MNNRNWSVINNKGNVAGHDMDEITARNCESIMQEQEPEAEWEAIENIEES
jgi:hypothetical protein